MKHPIGYVLALVIEISGELCAVLVITCILCFLVGSLFLFKTIVKDIAKDVPKLNLKKRSNENLLMATQNLRKIVHNFSNTKELSELFFISVEDICKDT